MLKPEQIKEKEFQTTGRGSYRSEDVDAFLSEVSESYDAMFKANAELVKKISILANKVEEYRKDENSLKEALIAAQKLADKIVREANEKVENTLTKAESEAKLITDSASKDASSMISDAKNNADGIIIAAKKEAEEILGTVNRKVTQESLAFDMLQKESSDFREKLIGMYKQHLTLINELPALAEEKIKETQQHSEQAEEKQESSDISEQKADEAAVEESSVNEETDKPEAVEEVSLDENTENISEDEQFILNDIEDDEDGFIDISSSDDKDESGFFLDLSNADFDEEDNDENSKSVAESPLAGNYAVADEKPAPEDDDDDEPVSFKSFFKKK